MKKCSETWESNEQEDSDTNTEVYYEYDVYETITPWYDGIEEDILENPLSWCQPRQTQEKRIAQVESDMLDIAEAVASFYETLELQTGGE